ncbi:hypothetical protein ABXY91_000114 [Vibrio fluvialis]
MSKKTKKQKNKKNVKSQKEKRKIGQLREVKRLNKIKELKAAFQSKVSLNLGDDEEIINKVDQVLHEIDEMNVDDLRQSLADLSFALHDVGESVIPYLILMFTRGLESIKNKETYQDDFIDEEIDSDKFVSLLQSSVMEYNGKCLRLKEYRIKNLKPSDEKVIYCTSRKMLDFYATEMIDKNDIESDLAPRIFSLAICRVLSKKYSCSNEFYYQFLSFLQRLNRDGFGQQARDFAEEALICSSEDGNIAFGHYCRFSLYVEQQNIIDSVLHGCMLITTLSRQSKINSQLLKNILFSSLKFYRESGFYSFGLSVYNYISESFTLDVFERQQIDTAMLYLTLLYDGVKVVGMADRYVQDNKSVIIDYKRSSQVPWLSLLYNIKHHFPNEYSKSNELNEFYNLMKAGVPDSLLEDIESKFAIDNASSKAFLKATLKKLSQTRNKQDIISESKQWLLTSGLVISSSIAQGDIEGVLLAHLLRSDSSVFLENKPLSSNNGLIPLSFNVNEIIDEKIDCYLDYIEKSLSNYKDTQFVWLGFDHIGRAYCVVYINKEFKFCDYLDTINLSSIKDWLISNVDSLGFDDSPQTSGPFETREDIWAAESIRINENLLDIGLPVGNEDTIIFTDVEFSPYPHNLIKNKAGDIIIERSPVTSALSLNNFIENTDNQIEVEKISVWAPICEGDYPIAIAYSKMQEELVNHNVEYFEGVKPDINALSNINAFISHGGRNELKGFKGLYPSDDKAYLNHGSIFGCGDIALLFVCHSGSIAKNYYSNSCHSLIKTLLSNGYKTVIAPSWSLNVCIPGIWTDAFITSMKSGDSCSKAAFIANKIVRETYNVESAWTAMHVFGNPDLALA